MAFHYEKSGSTDANVKTSAIMTGGAPGAQRLVYGTANGAVHHQLLADGSPVGPEAGIPVDNGAPDADVFTGPSPRGSVSPLDTSTSGSLGMTIVVHNDDNQDGARFDNYGSLDPRSGSDVAIAIIDQATGFELLDQAVGGLDPDTSADPAQRKANTINFGVASSPLLTDSDGNGDRSVVFVAERRPATVDPGVIPCTPGRSFEDQPENGLRGCDVPAATRLFQVVISDAGTPNATLKRVAAVDVSSANPLASPTLVNIAGTPHVVVSTTNGAVLTYAVSGLAPGPAVTTGLGGGEVYTASVPHQPHTEPSASDAAVYVAANVSGQNGVAMSQVHKIVVGTSGDLVVAASSPVIVGHAAPSLALTQQSAAGALTGGRVLYTTGNNLYSLDLNDLTRGAVLHIGSSLSPGTTGFSRTTAAGSGGLLYVARDNGDQLVLDERTLDTVPSDPTGFQQSPSNVAAPNAGVGQPAVSSGFVAYGNAHGVFVYRDQTAPTVNISEPADGAAVGRRVTLKATAYNARSGVAAVTFKLDGVVVATDTTPDTGDAFSSANPAVFSATVDLSDHGRGRFVLSAEAADGDTGDDAPSEVTVSPPRIISWFQGRNG